MPSIRRRATPEDFNIPLGVYTGAINGEQTKFKLHQVRNGSLADSLILKRKLPNGEWKGFATLWVRERPATLNEGEISLWPTANDDYAATTGARRLFQFIAWRFEPDLFPVPAGYRATYELTNVPEGASVNRTPIGVTDPYSRDSFGMVLLDVSTTRFSAVRNSIANDNSERSMLVENCDEQLWTNARTSLISRYGADRIITHTHVAEEVARIRRPENDSARIRRRPISAPERFLPDEIAAARNALRRRGFTAQEITLGRVREQIRATRRAIELGIEPEVQAQPQSPVIASDSVFHPGVVR